VDDEPEIRELLTYNFSRKGLDVSTASNGQIAYELVENSAPDVIVLDIMMPVMNGIELCRMLKSNQTMKNIPVLFLSATSDDMLVMAAMKAGGNHFVSKPIHLNMLLKIIYELYDDFQLKMFGKNLAV
jgi:DNA-binding response OmpR family regulator